MKRLLFLAVCGVMVQALCLGRLHAEPVPVAELATKIKAVGAQGKGNAAASQAWRELVRADAQQLPDLLVAMDGAGPLATNWLRMAVETVAQRQRDAKQPLPVAGLKKVLTDTSHHPKARRLAFELIVADDPQAKDQLVPSLLDDPSRELRRDAVAWALQRAEEAEPSGKQPAIAAYRKALGGARDEDQVKQAADKLASLGVEVSLPRHFGFVMRWRLIAPFDNAKKQGFDVAYPPEKRVDLTASYPGKDQEARWTQYTTSEDYGIVDLNEVLGKHKGAIAYAYSEFISDRARDVEVRLGCINGNKVWLNGELIISNHVYHANMSVDQYVGRGRLKQGKNTILVKVAQNEQEDPWAQRWQFQLRICDQNGTAILSQDRPVDKAASLQRRSGTQVANAK